MDESEKPTPGSIVAALSPMAAAEGIDLGLAAGQVDPVTIPPISLKQDPVNLARQIADQLCMENVFLNSAGNIVTINEVTGEEDPVTPLKFITWAGSRCYFYKKKDDSDNRIREGLGKEQAAIVLDSNEFRSKLRVFSRVVPVRLPTCQAGELVLLPQGYDPETRIFTVESLQYPGDWDLATGKDWLLKFIADFPWGDDGRSKAVWLAGILSPYLGVLCSALPPMFSYNANAAGSGKTILCKMGPMAVYGAKAGGVLTWDKIGDKLSEQLNAIARGNEPVLILDNVKGHVSSEALEAWLTSATWKYRAFHTQSMVTASKNTVTYLSGNECTLSDDLIRRTLVVDLFTEEANDLRAGGRKSAEIDEELLASQPIRSGFLASMWALTRHWWGAKCPRPPTRFPSYENWANTVGGVVVAAGFQDPLVKAELTSGGDASRTEFRRLLEAAVAAHPGQTDFSLVIGQWCQLCRQLGIYYQVLGSTDETYQHMTDRRLFRASPMGDAENPNLDDDHHSQAEMYMDKPQSTKLGIILHKKRGMKNTLTDGSVWQFGVRESRRTAFTMALIKPGGEPPADPF